MGWLGSRGVRGGLARVCVFPSASPPRLATPRLRRGEADFIGGGFTNVASLGGSRVASVRTRGPPGSSGGTGARAPRGSPRHAPPGPGVQGPRHDEVQ